MCVESVAAAIRYLYYIYCKAEFAKAAFPLYNRHTCV